MHVVAQRGCTNTVRESALKVDSGIKMTSRTGETNQPQRDACPTLYQLGYIPILILVCQYAVVSKWSHQIHEGRQRKRWEGNIREWTGLEFAKSQKAVENGEKWRKLVVVRG